MHDPVIDRFGPLGCGFEFTPPCSVCFWCGFYAIAFDWFSRWDLRDSLAVRTSLASFGDQIRLVRRFFFVLYPPRTIACFSPGIWWRVFFVSSLNESPCSLGCFGPVDSLPPRAKPQVFLTTRSHGRAIAPSSGGDIQPFFSRDLNASSPPPPMCSSQDTIALFFSRLCESVAGLF